MGFCVNIQQKTFLFESHAWVIWAHLTWLALFIFLQDTKSFDGWQLKKTILNTLLQAVKAIAGGVTQLKGQLIKGSGYLVSSGGKVRQSAIKFWPFPNQLRDFINDFLFS